MVGEAYLSTVIREFRKMKKLGDQALGRLSIDELNRSPAKESNSIAIIVKHLYGNMKSRWTDFLASDGEKPDRNRDSEFEGGYGSKEALLADWEAGWNCVFQAVGSLSSDDLLKTVTIRGEKHTVIQAIERQVSHYAYHVGQIVYLAKWMKDAEWESLSIPRGKSEEYNRRKKEEAGKG
jgi:hypothetical protein